MSDRPSGDPSRFEAVTSAARGRMTISVVDDDRSIRESLPMLLMAFGFDARVFASADDYLVSDAVDRSSCLVLDVVLRGMSGPALQLELQRRGHRVPIVFITAVKDEATRDRLIGQGAVDCLFKPFGGDALLDALQRATAGHRAVAMRGEIR